MTSFAEGKTTLAETVNHFCDTMVIAATSSTTSSSSSSPDERSKKLQELLDTESTSDGDLSALIQKLLEENEVDVAERFVRCISTIDTQLIENMLLSPQLLDMIKDMIEDMIEDIIKDAIKDVIKDAIKDAMKDAI